MVHVGEMAPEFTLLGTSGDGLTLIESRGQRRVLLLFYPRDRTTG